MIAGWWQKQSERDQRVLAVGAALVALLLAWAFVWYPLARARAQLESRVEHERTDLAWMLQSGGELQELRAKGARGKVDRQGKSLFALADVTARGAGLATALKRVEPTGSRSVRASFEAADFDALIGWVDVLARDYAVQTTDFSADRVEAIGTVNARVVLEEP
ncbi:MAG TPA: type II secretion system protein GspM [Rudaea sp.]|nr:type II secretion system protein GspM [Rudaea sp.]